LCGTPSGIVCEQCDEHKCRHSWHAGVGEAGREALDELLYGLRIGANAIPTALLFLGITALAYALLPRATGGICDGLLTVTFLWQLVGSLLGPSIWVLDLTPFAHVGLVPAHPVNNAAAALLTAIGLLAGVAALAAFRRRDLTAS